MTRPNIPAKANRVLNYILLALCLILIRVWYLGLFQHEKYLELAKKPRLKTVLQAPTRGTIHDRFQIPLAVNRINYFASILYEDIREIPNVRWIKNGRKKEKIYQRKKHITELSQCLAQELQMDPQDIEDIIYSRAAIFPSTHITIKDNLSEKQYYRLKSLERTFKGLHANKKAKRFYPQDNVGAEVLGYIGHIDEKEYFSRQQRIKTWKKYLKNVDEGLAEFLPQGFSSKEEVKLALEKELENPVLLTETLGKSGLEFQFDKDLKGKYGKALYEINTKGKYVRNLPGSKKALSGKTLTLSLSFELQAYAEKLLAHHEMERDKNFTRLGKDNHKVPPPWIKGGAIIAMVPTTGEIVCMASYPRMSNKDFANLNKEDRKSLIQASKWLENNYFISRIWDGKACLEREFYSLKEDKYFKEEKTLTLETYLDMILSPKSQVKKAIKSLKDIHECLEIIKAATSLLDLSEQPHMYSLIDALFQTSPVSSFGTSTSEKNLILSSLSQHQQYSESLKQVLTSYLSKITINDDKLLFLDLIRLITYPEPVEELAIQTLPLPVHHNLKQSLSVIKEEVLSLSKEVFHSHNFKIWREDCFKDYLKEKRKKEKEQKTYQKPYLDYLSKAESDLFSMFWHNYKWDLIASFIFDRELNIYELLKHETSLKNFKSELFKNQDNHKRLIEALNSFSTHLEGFSLEDKINYIKTLVPFKKLSAPLYGYYSQIKKHKGRQTLQDLAKAFYPSGGFGYGRSFNYRQSTPLGSIFKVVTAYEAIKQSYQRNPEATSLNPLTIRDEIHPYMKTPRGIVLGFTEDGKKITRRYKGGTLPRSHASLGLIDYVGAMERSSNIYFSLLASDVIKEPNDLIKTCLDFGFGQKTGLDLPGEIPGILPKDLEKNRSGLYAFAIGQHSLIATPLQTAMMLSSLCNDGEVLKPQILKQSIGKDRVREKLLTSEKNYPYHDYLQNAGIFFPFFLETLEENNEYTITTYNKHAYRKLYLPENIKNYLLDSLRSVVSSAKGNARPEIIRYLKGHPSMYKNYVKLRHQLAGKTSTAEIMYNPTLDRESMPIITKDVWFGALSFKDEKTSEIKLKQHAEPELVVVVYLRFGDYGKEAAPLASEIITKYRELCKKYQTLDKSQL